jgi:hypothetical protein
LNYLTRFSCTLTTHLLLAHPIPVTFSPFFSKPYHRFTGYYPESVHADRIYRTRENRAWCKEKGIRISGLPLGRSRANVSKERKKQAAYDERIRNAIEGKFGQGKRRFSLARIMAKLENTSRTAIAITFLVINLSTWWRQVFCVFLCRSGKTIAVSGLNMIGAYASVRLRQENLSLTLLSDIERFRSWFTINYSASPKYVICPIHSTITTLKSKLL